MLYGPPKVGKSTFCSKMKDPFFIETEPGLKFLKVRKVKVRDWVTFIAVVEEIESMLDDGFTCGVIVVDTIDNLGRFCMEYVCQKKNIEHPSDEEWGKGWEAFSNEWAHWINRLCTMDVGVVFIGHSKERDVVSRSLTITKVMPAMQTTTYRYINALVDFILYAGFAEVKVRDKKTKKIHREERRYLYTKPSESIDAGDRSGVLPAKIPFSFEEFSKVFYGDE